MTDNWKSGDPIGYIQPDIPDFEAPPFAGQRYEALVPDTLDLAERARLAIHAMTENPNPEADYEPYWNVCWVPVPFMRSDFCSPSITPKFQEAVCLDRLICGSDQNLHVDRRWMEITVKQQGPDGLIYTPTRGRPWAFRLKPFCYARSDTIDRSAEQLLGPFISGQMLRTMSLYAAREGSSFWPERIRKLVDGLTSLAVDAGDYAYFWPGPFHAFKDHPPDVKPCFQFHLVETSLISFGLSCAYRQTGYEPALSLAGKLITFQREVFFTPQGEFLTAMEGAIKGHVHGHARGLQSMAEYGLLTSDDELLEFVVRSYEWTKRGIETLTGFVPNHVNCPEWRQQRIKGEMDKGITTEYLLDEYNGCEVAGLADMIGVAMVLSQAGVADYWDDVDRWVRNMLAESQMLQSDWVDYLPGARMAPITLGVGQTDQRVAARNLGAWPTGAAPNDWYPRGTGWFGFVHGDTACAARSLYWIWNGILTYQGGKLKVNLLLNRASPWADVDSLIPYQGRVDIKVKQSVDLSVRIAEWVQPKDTRVQVNGAERTVGWDGRYAHVGSVKPDDTVVVTFPISERTDTVLIQKTRYKLVRRGNEVVSIFPRGVCYPFYQRDHYRTGQTRWRKAARFVCDQQIDW